MSDDNEKLLEDVEDWIARVDKAAKLTYDSETERRTISFPAELFNELCELFGAEDEDPRAMGWVGYDGRP